MAESSWQELLARLADERINVACAPEDLDRVRAAVGRLERDEMYLVRPSSLVAPGEAFMWAGDGELPTDARRLRF